MKEKFDNIIKKMNGMVNTKNMLILITILLIVSLIPIIHVSFYTHPSADDFSYGVYTINKIKTEGILGVLSGTIKTLDFWYNSWQGTYSAIILFSLNPTVWGNNLYFLTTIIIVFMLFLGLFYLFKIVFVDRLKLNKKLFLIILFSFFLLVLETIPDKVQGLYWWNGASYYMLFYSLELILISLLIKRYDLESKTKFNYILLILLVFVISGGNFITALQQMILLVFLNFYLILIKKDKTAIPLFVTALVGFLISALAPGNASRASIATSMNPILAIIKSFYFSIISMIKWTTPLNIIIIFLLTLLLVPSYKQNNFKHRYPLYVIFLSYCIFSAEFTPTLYSTSTLGEGRLWNIMYISYLLFVFVNFYYILGYIRNKLLENKIFNKNALNGIINILKTHSFTLFAIFIAFIGCNLYIHKGEYTSYKTYKILNDGSAKIYHQEYQQRIKLLENKNIKEVEFEKLSNYPHPIFYCEFSEDKDNWLNEPIAKIYNKKYVVLKEEEENEEE